MRSLGLANAPFQLQQIIIYRNSRNDERAKYVNIINMSPDIYAISYMDNKNKKQYINT